MSILHHFSNTALAIDQLLESSSEQLYALETMAQAMVKAIQSGRKILVCGNGGSACQAMHFAEELTGRYRHDRAALPALSLTDSGHLTCVANDYGYEHVFARALEAYGGSGDVLLLLSTSGHSANLLRAAEVAQKREIVTTALLGKDGGLLKEQCQHAMIASGATADCIQNIHMIAIHALIESIERALFPGNYRV